MRVAGGVVLPVSTTIGQRIIVYNNLQIWPAAAVRRLEIVLEEKKKNTQTRFKNTTTAAHDCWRWYAIDGFLIIQ